MKDRHLQPLVYNSLVAEKQITDGVTDHVMYAEHLSELSRQCAMGETVEDARHIAVQLGMLAMAMAHQYKIELKKEIHKKSSEFLLKEYIRGYFI